MTKQIDNSGRDYGGLLEAPVFNRGIKTNYLCREMPFIFDRCVKEVGQGMRFMEQDPEILCLEPGKV